jgi:ACR3 family arsenite efflux pump ArsB
VTTRRFFALTLLFPLALGLLGLVTPALSVFSAALLFGGIPYAPIAFIAAVQIRRAETKRRLVLVSMLAPLAFAPLAFAFSWVVGSNEATSQLPISEIIAQLLPVAAYSLIIGYFYVGLSWGLWALARKLDLVRDELAT